MKQQLNVQVAFPVTPEAGNPRSGKFGSGREGQAGGPEEGFPGECGSLRPAPHGGWSHGHSSAVATPLTPQGPLHSMCSEAKAKRVHEGKPHSLR